MTVLWSILGFIIAIGVLVTIHEWGHYQAARWFNIKITHFSIGFGRPIWVKQGKETRFQIAMLPLGGYVRFADEAEGPVDEADLPRAFNRQSVYKRFIVVAAGPLINIVFAWALFSLIYMIGVSGLKPIFEHAQPDSALEQVLPKKEQAWLITEIDHHPVHTWRSVHERLLKALVADQTTIHLTLESLQSGEHYQIRELSLNALDLNNHKQSWLSALGFQPYAIPIAPVIGTVSENSPAHQAGLKAGDKILAINQSAIAEWQQLVEMVRQHPGQTIELSFERNGQPLTKSVTLNQITLKNGQTVGQLGVGAQRDSEAMAPFISTERYDFLSALELGALKTLELSEMSMVMLKKIVFGEAALENLSGPVSIAQFSGQALQTGLISFLSLLALLSLSLGILNLLPIPVLDGGHLVYYMVEAVKGSPVSEGTMLVGQKIGLFLIVGLTILALTNDILRIANG
ncbi:RIP metalloprotease RseP [Thiomicrorhabdus sp. zzn3]|uniref:RIP metalloprotease RseP n=1 Tax=Thiomicrorhabdus sp. zzn3 TaxID=3039775 RepID=UPI002436310F|nr:RIP metalloprotease RseP [Thiomicrorhabdus sp. zzn3]MDG6777982.1 RIP metalloprotease RseP [Thiomicrorhabdus sp. zzn3]